LNILEINYTDINGSRFNGYDLCKHYRKIGHQVTQCVWYKLSDDENVFRLFDIPWREYLYGVVGRIERYLSVQYLFSPFIFQLFFSEKFRKADILHLHIIHNGFFNLLALPLLSRFKPTVWTLHDPWALTGHCVHMYGCERWKCGCGSCSKLDSLFPLEKDRTAFMWKLKKFLYKKSRLNIIVSSSWMQDLVKQSTLLSDCPVYRIPFGIDLSVFKPLDVAAIRKRLGIHPGHFVLGFRATTSEFKGLEYILQILDRLNVNVPITLLTFNEIGLVDRFKDRFQVIDLGWLTEEDQTAEAINAVDIMLMPSIAESFGMMAIESMACAKPVIAFDGTALPETLVAPEGGVAVPFADVDSFAAVLERLIDNEEERLALGERALQLARTHYDFNMHAQRVMEAYTDVIQRCSASCEA
jgi:glycosyltransferase involved in cell wall biosynthesis